MSLRFRSANIVLLLLSLYSLAGCNAFHMAGYLSGGPPSPDYMSDETSNDSSAESSDPRGELDFSHVGSLDGTAVPRYINRNESVASMVESISPGFEGNTTENFNRVQKPAQSKRLMIYSAKFSVATPTVNETIERFLDGVNAIGGYLESRNDERVVVRIPAESFDRIVGNMPSLGDVLSRSVKNEDVTRKHRDLKLRLETLAVARQRIIELLQSADKVDDVVKLEERLGELTLQLEMAQGEYKTLSEQVVYSRVEVDFQTKSEETVTQRTNKSSPFSWINDIGVNGLENGFSHGDMDQNRIRRTVATTLPGAVGATLPKGFLVVKRTRKELRAVTASDARLRIRQVAAPKKGTLEFWSNSLVNHLVNNRGYELVQERQVHDSNGRKGRQLTFDVVTGGTPTRYLTTLFVEQRPFWSRNNEIEVTEFVAPTEEFEPYVTAFHQSRKWRVADEQRFRIEPQYAENPKSSDDDLVRGQSSNRQAGSHFFTPAKSR